MNFQKPEKYLKEIAHFLDNVTIVPELTKKMNKGHAFTAKQARELISTLLKLMAPNLEEEFLPQFKSPDIQNLFATLQYPFTIRPDAITAVGAPNSFAYLIKAIYWLYLAARTYYGSPQAVMEVEEEDAESKMHQSESKSMLESVAVDEEQNFYN